MAKENQKAYFPSEYMAVIKYKKVGKWEIRRAYKEESYKFFRGDEVMNELIGHTANVMLGETKKGQLTATVELIFLVSEPKYQADLTGFVKTRSVTDIRFATNAKGLRNMAKELGELADEAEELEERASLKSEETK